MIPPLHARNQTAVKAVGGSRGSIPKKAKSIVSGRKVVASVFWVAKGILLTDYLDKGRKITGEYYCNLPDLLDVKIHKKRPGLK